MALLWGAGALRLQQAGDVAGPSPGPVVRVVDPGFTQREKWTPGREAEVLSKYLALTEPANANLARIVIWPEGALPARYPEFPPLLENAVAVNAIANVLGDRVLITGLTRVEADSEGRIARAYNAAAVLKGEEGTLRLGQIHDKYRLTPFGEFIPLFNLISWLDIPTLQMIGSGFTPGPRPQRVVVPGADPAIIQICYESIFPGLIPRGQARPGWIVNVTNDAWFGKATGPWQHYNQARYRAIEEGLPMARAASGGVSAIVDSFGREVASTGMAGGAAEASLPGRLKETLYARLGWIITPIILVLLAAMRFAWWRGTRRTS
jgi:apolipoprotein N-acyltransferase